MKLRPWIMFALLALFAMLLPARPAQGDDEGPLVVVMDVHGPVAPAMQIYIERGLSTAASRQAELLVIQLNTPGGSVDTMNQIQSAIRASKVPVVVYVAPRGAMAASAGTIITLAGHAAAMAPETTIGAASPVDSNGQNIESTLESKVKEVLKATVRVLAADRPPAAVTLAEQMIDNARAVTSGEALRVGLVDYQVDSVPALVTALDGKKLNLPGGAVVLHTAGARIEPLNQTLIEQALQIFTDSNLVFLFLSAGIWAILIELSSPGGWVAGFTGAVLLLLALFGMGVLPVNWFGLLFIALAILLFVLDIKAPTHGALTAAGTASFIAGALVLFNSVRTPGFVPLSVPLVVGVALFMAASFFGVVLLALQAQTRPVLTGKQAMLGKVGVVRLNLRPKGQVQVAGELWTARVEDGAAAIGMGERVEVVGFDGVVLIVKKAHEDEAAA